MRYSKLVPSYLDPTSFLDLAFMLVATILALLSVRTLQLLARVGLSKSLFIPVLVSAVFFWYGSTVNVVYNICLQSVPSLASAQGPMGFLHQVTLLMGLSILTAGVFSYWRLTSKVKVPKHERLKDQIEQQDATDKVDQQKEEMEQETIKTETKNQQLQQESQETQNRPQQEPEVRLMLPEFVATKTRDNGSQTASTEHVPE